MRFILGVLLSLLTLLALSARAEPPVFAPVTPGAALTFPRDYGAHPEFRTEWWYVTGWVETPDKRPLGFQVTFFRSRTGVDGANPSHFTPRQLVIGHAALSDPAVGRLVHDQRSARTPPLPTRRACGRRSCAATGSVPSCAPRWCARS